MLARLVSHDMTHEMDCWQCRRILSHLINQGQAYGIRRVSMLEGHGAIYTQIGSPSAYPWTPAHPGIFAHATLDRQPGRLEGLLPHGKYGNQLGTCPQEGAGHLVAQVKSTRLVLQRMSRGRFLP